MSSTGLNYAEVINDLSLEVGCIIFFKKNGDLRLMLATRDLQTLGLLGDTDDDTALIELKKVEARSNIKNGNVPVVDLEIEEGRAFNIQRVVKIEYLGRAETKEELESIKKEYEKIKAHYMVALSEGMYKTMDYLGD